MALLKVIEWQDNTKNTIVYKFVPPNNKDQINKGSKLTVRESQLAIFTDKGRLADIFLPGFYTLDTNNIPLLTKLMSWKYGFESPFKSDVFFVSTKQFINQKWGTSSPIYLFDPAFGRGNVAVRGFGSYAFQIDGDRGAEKFLKQIFGSGRSYKTEDINDYLKSMVITGITDAFGNSGVPVSRFAGNLRAIGQEVQKTLEKDFAEIGLKLSAFNVENFSFPPEIEAALNKSAALNIESDTMHVQLQKAQAEALVAAAKNPQSGVMGAGMGVGMGVNMGRMFGDMMNSGIQEQQPKNIIQVRCTKCGALNSEKSKFCNECGTPLSNPCCPNCKKEIKAGAKFCPECGTRL